MWTQSAVCVCVSHAKCISVSEYISCKGERSQVAYLPVLPILPWQGSDKLSAGIRKPYVRVVGIHVETEGPGRTSPAGITPHEEEELRKLAAQPDIYDIIARSIAPSIYGSVGEHQMYA